MWHGKPAAAPSLASRVRPAAWLATAALLGALSGCASTGGSIRGTLIPPASRAAPRAARSGLDVRQAVIVAVPDHASKTRLERRGGRRHVLQTASGFDPQVISVPVGTVIEFENRDAVYHNAFSVSPARKFDTGLYAPGQSRPVLFDHAGVVQVFCELHPQFVGYVVVVDQPFSVRPNARGEFNLANLPEGRYAVKAWHPVYGETTGRVSVSRGGRATLRLDY